MQRTLLARQWCMLKTASADSNNNGKPDEKIAFVSFKPMKDSSSTRQKTAVTSKWAKYKETQIFKSAVCQETIPFWARQGRYNCKGDEKVF